MQMAAAVEETPLSSSSSSSAALDSGYNLPGNGFSPPRTQEQQSGGSSMSSPLESKIKSFLSPKFGGRIAMIATPPTPTQRESDAKTSLSAPTSTHQRQQTRSRIPFHDDDEEDDDGDEERADVRVISPTTSYVRRQTIAVSPSYVRSFFEDFFSEEEKLLVLPGKENAYEKMDFLDSFEFLFFLYKYRFETENTFFSPIFYKEKSWYLNSVSGIWSLRQG